MSSVPVKDELLVLNLVSVAEDGVNALFRITDGKIRLSNRYFSTSISARVLSESEVQSKMLDAGFISELNCIPAVALVTSDDHTSIQRCKDLANAIVGHCSDDIVATFYVHGNRSTDEERSGLIRWGLQRNIEIMSDAICEEDGLDVSTRLQQALSCAKWRQACTCCADRVPEEEDRVIDEDDGERPTNYRSDGHIKPAQAISQPTRLRRGFNADDVERLINDLALTDDSHSDE